MKLTRSVSVTVRRAVRKTWPTGICSYVSPRMKGSASAGSTVLSLIAIVSPFLSLPGLRRLQVDRRAAGEVGLALVPVRGDPLGDVRAAEAEELQAEGGLEDRRGGAV